MQKTHPHPTRPVEMSLGFVAAALGGLRLFCTSFALVYRLSCLLCLAIEGSVSYSGFTNNLNSFYNKIFSEPFLLFETTTVLYSFILKSSLNGWFLRGLLVFKNLE